MQVAPLLGRQAETLMDRPYPQVSDLAADDSAERALAWVRQFILGVRRIRAENNLEPAKRIPVRFHGGSPEERSWLKAMEASIRHLARLESLEDSVEAGGADATTALAGDMTILVPLLDLIDPAVERERLTKEIARLTQDLERVEAKLANASFVERAPAEVVEKERRRAADNRDQVARFSEQLARLPG